MNISYTAHDHKGDWTTRQCNVTGRALRLTIVQCPTNEGDLPNIKEMFPLSYDYLSAT
jgi:hypothetical protein